MEQQERSATDRIRIFRDLFTGLKEVYGTYDPKTGILPRRAGSR